VAVVSAGRAGKSVAIKDESPAIEKQKNGAKAPKYSRRFNSMANVKRKKPSERGLVPVLARLFPFFAKDANPEEVMEALEDLVEVVEEEFNVEPAADKADTVPAVDVVKVDAADKTDDCPEWAKAIIQGLKDCTDRLDAMDAAREKDADPLEKLEEELSKRTDDIDVEAELIEPAAEIEAEDESADGEGMADVAGPVMPVSGRPKTLLNKDAALKEIKAMKPIIAEIADTKKRKAMADSMARLIRATYGLSTGGQGNKKANNYAAIIETQQRNAKKLATKDAKTGTAQENMSTLAAEKITARRNALLAQKN
jgi:hypothetical protein